MSAAAIIDDEAPKRRRGMLGFYVACLALVVLAGLGAWLWTSWTNWQFGEAEARRRQAEAARQLGVPVETTVDLGGGVGIELVLIPAGMFDMGSPEDDPDRWPYEGPIHRVRISQPFYIGKCEVTKEAWGEVMWKGFNDLKDVTLPAIGVSWYDCQDFLKRLNALGKAKGEFRLPTEAEWEWACRAGARTRFCFGDDDAQLAEYAWFYTNSDDETHQAGKKRPNAWGLHDCHGNISEWCSNWFYEYSANAWPGVFRWQTDPCGPISRLGRGVRRGGSSHDDPGTCRSAGRCEDVPSNSYTNVGFRVVLSVAGP